MHTASASARAQEEHWPHAVARARPRLSSPGPTGWHTTRMRGAQRAGAPAPTLGVADVSGPSASAPESKWQSLPIGPQSCTSTSLHAIPQPSAQASVIVAACAHPLARTAAPGRRRAAPHGAKRSDAGGTPRAWGGEGTLTHLRAGERVRLRAVPNGRLGAVADRARHCGVHPARVSGLTIRTRTPHRRMLWRMA